jgi:hypothetical protein
VGKDELMTRAATWPCTIVQASACSGSGSTELITSALVDEFNTDEWFVELGIELEASQFVFVFERVCPSPI